MSSGSSQRSSSRRKRPANETDFSKKTVADDVVGKDVVGAYYEKKFVGYGTWTARVQSYDAVSDRYTCKYVDGYTELLSRTQLSKYGLFVSTDGNTVLDPDTNPDEHPMLYVRKRARTESPPAEAGQLGSAYSYMVCGKTIEVGTTYQVKSEDSEWVTGTVISVCVGGETTVSYDHHYPVSTFSRQELTKDVKRYLQSGELRWGDGQGSTNPTDEGVSTRQRTLRPAANEVLVSDSDEEESEPPQTVALSGGDAGDAIVILDSEASDNEEASGKDVISQPPVTPTAPVTKTRNVVLPDGKVRVKPEPLPFGMADCPPDVTELTKDQFYGTLSDGPIQEAAGATGDQDKDQDKDLVFLSTTDESSVANLPHGRTECFQHKFLYVSKLRMDKRRKQNKNFCPSCYCLVCEVPAKDCSHWDRGQYGGHCMANLKGGLAAYWKQQKRVFSNTLLRALGTLPASTLAVYEDAHEDTRSCFRRYYEGRREYDDDEFYGSYERMMGYGGSYRITHRFSAVKETTDRLLKTAALLLGKSSQSEKVKGVCLLDAVTEILCRESWSPQNSDVMCASDEWDPEAESKFSKLVHRVGMQWFRIVCPDSKPANKEKETKKRKIDVRVLQGMAEGRCNSLVCEKTGRTVLAHEWYFIGVCSYAASRDQLDEKYAGKTQRHLRCPNCPTDYPGHSKYQYKKSPWMKEPHLPSPEKYAQELLQRLERRGDVEFAEKRSIHVSLPKTFLSPIAARLKALASVSSSSYARQMLKTMIGFSATGWKHGSINAIEAGTFMPYKGCLDSSEARASFGFRIDMALENGNVQLACRLMLASPNKMVLSRLVSGPVTQQLRNPPFQFSSQRIVDLAMYSPHVTYKDMCYLAENVDRDFAVTKGTPQMIWCLFLRTLIGEGGNKDAEVSVSTKELSFDVGGRLGITIGPGPLGRIYVVSIDPSFVEKNKALGAMKVGDMIVSVNGSFGSIGDILTDPTIEKSALAKATELLSNIPSGGRRKITLQRCKYSVESLQQQGSSVYHFQKLFAYTKRYLSDYGKSWAKYLRPKRPPTSSRMLDAANLVRARFVMKTEGFTEMEAPEIIRITQEVEWGFGSSFGKSEGGMSGYRSYAELLVLTSMLFAKHIMNEQSPPERAVMTRVRNMFFIVNVEAVSDEIDRALPTEIMLWCCYFSTQGHATAYGQTFIKTLFEDCNACNVVTAMIKKYTKKVSGSRETEPRHFFTRDLIENVFMSLCAHGDDVSRKKCVEWIMITIKYLDCSQVDTLNGESFQNDYAALFSKLLKIARGLLRDRGSLHYGAHAYYQNISSSVSEIEKLLHRKFKIKDTSAAYPYLACCMEWTNFYEKVTRKLEVPCPADFSVLVPFNQLTRAFKPRKDAGDKVRKRVLENIISDMFPEEDGSQSITMQFKCIRECCCATSQWFPSVVKFLAFCKDAYGVDISLAFRRICAYPMDVRYVHDRAMNIDVEKVNFKPIEGNFGSMSVYCHPTKQYDKVAPGRIKFFGEAFKNVSMSKETKSLLLNEFGIWLRLFCADPCVADPSHCKYKYRGTHVGRFGNIQKVEEVLTSISKLLRSFRDEASFRTLVGEALLLDGTKWLTRKLRKKVDRKLLGPVFAALRRNMVLSHQEKNIRSVCVKLQHTSYPSYHRTVALQLAECSGGVHVSRRVIVAHVNNAQARGSIKEKYVVYSVAGEKVFGKTLGSVVEVINRKLRSTHMCYQDTIRICFILKFDKDSGKLW